MNYLKLLGILLISGMGLIATASQAESAQDVLISNGSNEITREDFEADMLRIPEEYRFEFRADPERINKVLTNLYLNRVLAYEAKKAGLDKAPLFQKRIQLYVDAQLAKAWLDHKMDTAKLPDFEARAKELYRAEPEKYFSATLVSASHILIDTKDRTDCEALKRAQEVREKALHGESFAKLAEEYSDDPSAKKNKGDIGYFAAARMVKPFSDHAFAMKTVGEISEPVKTEFGYHIIRFQGRKEGTLQDFDKVKSGIIEELKTKYLGEMRADTLGAIVNSKDKRVNEDAILRLKTELPLAAKPAVK